MKEQQLSADEFRQWLRPPRPHGKDIEAFFTILGLSSQDQHLLAAVLRKHSPKKPAPVKPSPGKPDPGKPWSAFESAHCRIAVNVDGTVVVKGIHPNRFTLWIRPNGDAGTNSTNKLVPADFISDVFIKNVAEVVAGVDAWARQGKGRVLPPGPALLFERIIELIEVYVGLFSRDDHERSDLKARRIHLQVMDLIERMRDR